MSLAPSVTHPSFTCTEHDLVAAVRRGDDRAFEELYSRYRSRISSYILGMVGDHARAEDIAQEVFISALRRLRDTERPMAVKPWLYEIAKNACIDEFRRSRRSREISIDREDAGRTELPSWRPGPDAAMASKQSLDDLRSAFHGLSENHHKIIVMRELEGLSYGQIGEKLGMSRPMVESTLFRARKKLSEEYDELVSGRRCGHVQMLIAGEETRSLLKLGVRERRQLARHLSHCQPCRREARMAGVDESFFQAPKTLAGKIAALLPFPWLRWRRSGGGGDGAAAASGSHSWNLAQRLHTVARLGDPSGPVAGIGRAAAAAAAIAAAGIGAGVAVSGGASHSGARPPMQAQSQAADRGLPSSAARGANGHRGGGAGNNHRSSTGGNGGGFGGSGTEGSVTTARSAPRQAAGQSGGAGGAAGGGGGGAGGQTGAPRTHSVPAINLPKPKRPGIQLPKVQLPKLQLPKVQSPKTQVPKMQVPKVTVHGAKLPDPNKVVKHLLGG